jgi:hypothetical protein
LRREKRGGAAQCLVVQGTDQEMKALLVDHTAVLASTLDESVFAGNVA